MGPQDSPAGTGALCVYVVYHSTLYPDNYREYSDDDLARWVRLYAVNETVPKAKETGRLEALMGRLAIKEWELPWHDPLQQMNNMYNNSAMWHVWRNSAALPRTDFVGFAQYDMVIPREALEGFEALTDHPNRVGYLFPHSWHDFLQHSAVPQRFWQDTLAKLGVDVTWEELVAGRPVPLMHGLILPTPHFERMMEWLDGTKGHLVRALGHDTRHLAGTLERAIALWVAAHVHAGQLGPAVCLTGCVHADHQRLEDPFRGVA